MMLKIIKYLFTLLIGFTISINVYAFTLCSDAEIVALNKEAANIKAGYTLIKGEGTHQKYFQINILNLTDKFYLRISNSYNYDKPTFYFNEKNFGIISYDWDIISVITTFTIDVYTSSKTSCPNEKITTVYLTTPRRNELSYTPDCIGNEDYFLCQEFVTFDEMEYTSFQKQLKSYEAGNQTEEGEEVQQRTVIDNVLSFIVKNKVYFIIGISVVAVGFVTGLIISRKRRVL